MNPITDVREEYATLLRNNLPSNVGVFDAIPDSIAPPTVFVTWSNPWLINFTWCDFVANVQLIVVTQRIEPGGQYGVLEDLVFQLVGILRDNKLTMRDITSPYPISLGGVNYLACSINLIHDLESR